MFLRHKELSVDRDWWKGEAEYYKELYYEEQAKVQELESAVDTAISKLQEVRADLGKLRKKL